eukprot:9007250-Lingulodinium_polyedra.AAC.1
MQRGEACANAPNAPPPRWAGPLVGERPPHLARKAVDDALAVAHVDEVTTRVRDGALERGQLAVADLL